MIVLFITVRNLKFYKLITNELKKVSKQNQSMATSTGTEPASLEKIISDTQVCQFV